jgi:fumarylacetoacetate (FAA) hydrolase
MRLATVLTSSGGRAAVWCDSAEGSEWIDLETAGRSLGLANYPSSLKNVLEREGPNLATPRQVKGEFERGTLGADVKSWPVSGARLAPPIPDPGTLIDFYAFEEHVRRARARRGLEIIPQWYQYPVYYRSNQRAVIGHDAQVLFPAGESRMDYELEIAAVLGATLESPSPDEAEKAIAGYCLFNDWSARAIQAEVMKVGLGPAKGKDFASSIGPWIVTPDELGPLDDLEVCARVNSEVWSQARVGAMQWRWGEMLAFAGDGVRFEPGDIFGSGTVGGGCGLELGRFLEVGDVVELDGGPALGVLRGTVGQAKE